MRERREERDGGGRERWRGGRVGEVKIEGVDGQGGGRWSRRGEMEGEGEMDREGELETGAGEKR